MTAGDVADLTADFVERPDISARSTLVTVFGDTIAPTGGEVWLTALFDLLGPFPFSERLIRTSLSRLVGEGWVTSERIGRRSRYALTPAARAETAAAEQRIYHRASPRWTGEWTLVLVDADDAAAAELAENGFARLAPGVMAVPDDGTDRHQGVLHRLGVDATHPVATAAFSDSDVLIGGDRLTHGFGLDHLISGYEAFLDRYGPLAHGDAGRLSPAEAFAARTMVVHELRRLRLRDPDLPVALLPDPWVGHIAHDVAAGIYAAVTDRTWTWVFDTIGEPAAGLDARVGMRFAMAPTVGAT